jgi:hypothetical protein
MAYVETGDKKLKFVLTTKGKEEGLREGFLNIFKYFTVGDSQVIYTLESSPNNLIDINGSHETSTNVSSCPSNNNIINK